MSISTATYERVALEDDDYIWELDGGLLRRKPDMTHEHNNAAMELVVQISAQLDHERYALRTNGGHLAASPGHSFVPDVWILPRQYFPPPASRPGGLETFDQPMPFVCEVWSPSTGDYDTDKKIPWYQARRRRDLARPPIRPHRPRLAARAGRQLHRRRPLGRGHPLALRGHPHRHPAALPGLNRPRPASSSPNA